MVASRGEEPRQPGQAGDRHASPRRSTTLNAVSGDVVGALGGIKDAIDGVNEFVANTAAAVEEQSIVTSDMSANMQKAASELAA